MRKATYTTPVLEILVFATEDVITVSGESSSASDSSEESTQPVLPWD